MAVPASAVSLKKALDNALAIAGGIKSLSLHIRGKCLAGAIEANLIVDLWERLLLAKSQIQTLAQTPGLTAYAQEQLGNDQLDIAAEFQAMFTALDAVITEIETRVPKDSTNTYLAVASWGSGVLTYRTFPTTATATLAGLLNTLAGTIS